MNLAALAWRELSHRRASLASGLVAITLGIAVIVGIRSVATASQRAVAVKLDSLGANVLVLPQGHPLAGKSRVALEDIAEYPLITYHLAVDERPSGPVVVEEWLRWKRGSHGFADSCRGLPR